MPELGLVPIALPILLVGGGRMGEAIVAGVLGARVARAEDVIVAEPDEKRRMHLADSLGVRVVPDATTVVADAGIVILAVKPQVIDEVAGALSEHLARPVPVVSIAAGVPSGRLESFLPDKTPVIRVMPNTPALVGQGVSAVSGGTYADEDIIETAVGLFAALGEVIVVDERLQDAVTGVSGSGPAYVALFVQALADGGVANGLTSEAAYALALQTVRGTAELLERTAQTPQELVDAVSSPGGTTVAAREALTAGGFEDSVRRAVDAAVQRAKELGSP